MSDFWRDRSVFVTGASGLLGGWLVEALVNSGAEVCCLVRDWAPKSRLLSGDLKSEVSLVRGDVTEQVLLERALGEYECDTVFHLAAQTIVEVANRNPAATFASNIGGTAALCEACLRSPKVRQVVVASSDKAYGDQRDLPYKETAPLLGLHPYDASKACADIVSRSYAHSFGLPIVVTRCGNLFGGGDLNWNRLIPGTIRSILRGNAPIIRSDGTFIRDYFYVEDGAEAYMSLAEALAKDRTLSGEAFNFSYESQFSVMEIVDRILKAMNSDMKPDIQNTAACEIRHQYLSSAKARERLNWKPSIDFDAGLERTIAWYQSFLENHP